MTFAKCLQIKQKGSGLKLSTKMSTAALSLAILSLQKLWK